MQAFQLTGVVAAWTLVVLLAFAVAGGPLLQPGEPGAIRSLAYMFFIGLWLLGAALAGIAAGGLGVGVFAVASWLSIVILPRFVTDGEAVRQKPLLAAIAIALAISLLGGWAAFGRG